ncbi:hypothetical protein BC937DRAFT_86644, partial [Endogone sp. FLAS-F59071]
SRHSFLFAHPSLSIYLLFLLSTELHKFSNQPFHHTKPTLPQYQTNPSIMPTDSKKDKLTTSSFLSKLSKFKQVENENISMWRELKRQNKTIKTLTSRYSINSAENVLGYLLTHQVDNGNGSTTLNTIVTNMTNGPDFLPAPQTVFAPSDESSSALPNVADNIIMTQESIDTPSQQINILDNGYYN